MRSRDAMSRYELLVLAFAGSVVVACTTNDETGNDPLVDGARKEVHAPIEAAEVVVRESFPPQYAVHIKSGLPSGCAAFERIDVERADTVIELTVWNTLPTDETLACTTLYGIVDNTAELGSDFDSGRTYDVRINGESRVTFTAQ